MVEIVVVLRIFRVLVGGSGLQDTAAELQMVVAVGLAFGIVEGIAVDTHVTRLSKKIGFTNSEDVAVIEKDLMRKIPKEIWGTINHILVEHGKNICIARRPKCEKCCIKYYCREYKKSNKYV